MGPWLLSLVLLASSRAQTASQPPPEPASGFVWEAPAQVCPSSSVAQGKLASLADFADAGVQASAKVRREGAAWMLTLEMVAGDMRSERVLSAESCDTLLEAAVFSYSLAVERRVEELAEEARAEASMEPSEPAPAAPVIAEAEPAPEPEAVVDGIFIPPSDQPRRPARKPLEWTVRAHGGLGQGALGLGTAPVGGSLGLGGTRWRAELGAGAYLPREVTLTQPDTAGARLSAWMIRGRGCGLVPLGERWILPLCGQLDGGLMRASGFGVQAPAQPQSPHLTASGVLGAAVLLGGRVRLWMDLQGGVSLLRAGFTVDGATEALFRAPAGTFGADIGVEVRFGGI